MPSMTRRNLVLAASGVAAAAIAPRVVLAHAQVAKRIGSGKRPV